MKNQKKEEYSRIKEVFSAIPEINIHEKHGGRFLFPIYMTETLAQTDIDALELGARSLNCLRRSGIHTIGDLCNRVRSSRDLLGIKNCGKTSIAEIMDHLFAYQFSILKPERRGKYLVDVVRMNAGSDPN